MAITMTLLPDDDATAQVVHGPMDPPSLVVDSDGTRIVLRPADQPGGMTEAARFASVLAQAALTWERLCSRQLALAASADPLDVNAIIEQVTDGGRSGERWSW